MATVVVAMPEHLKTLSLSNGYHCGTGVELCLQGQDSPPLWQFPIHAFPPSLPPPSFLTSCGLQIVAMDTLHLEASKMLDC